MSIIICPNCKSILHPFEKTVKCQNGHSFDLAKTGYLNLLLANQKRKINPGDNKVMINARDAFLETGSFDFLLESIESSIDFDVVNFLDVGCGSGFYTRNLFKKENLNRVGIDISKTGISKASMKDKESTYIVGSVFNLAVEDDSIDLLVNIFAPLDLEECKRVLRPGGYFVKVIPIGDHMKEIAELVYEKFIPHESSIKEEIESHSMLKITKVDVLKRSISLSKQDLVNFITMTPYLYKFAKSELESLEEMSVTLSFEVIIGRFA